MAWVSQNLWDMRQAVCRSKRNYNVTIYNIILYNIIDLSGYRWLLLVYLNCSPILIYFLNAIQILDEILREKDILF